MPTLGSLDILNATIDEPREGIWHASLELDEGELPSGLVTIDLDGVSFTGTVMAARSGEESGRLLVRVQGGGGALQSDIPAQGYEQPSLATVLGGILAATGDTLSGDSVDLAGVIVSRWTRLAGPANRALQAVARATGYVWRTTRAGEVFFGADKFSEVDVPHLELDQDPRGASMLIAPEDGALVAPGTTFLGRPVTHVRTEVTGEGVRQTLRFDDDRVRGVWQRLVETIVGDRLVYGELHPATVVVQRADGTVDVQPDDPDLGTLAGVGIRNGLPGVKVLVEPGARVRLGFDDARPDRPFVALWDAATDGSPIARVDDDVECGELFLASGLLYYTPPGPVRVWSPVASDTDPPDPSVQGTPILGVITSGNDNLLA